jgi:hypothetical protein
MVRTKVLINSNMLMLIGVEQKYYDKYFDWDDISEKIMKH